MIDSCNFHGHASRETGLSHLENMVMVVCPPNLQSNCCVDWLVAFFPSPSKLALSWAKVDGFPEDCLLYRGTSSKPDDP